MDLVVFIKIFSKYYQQDYFSDSLTNALLRKFNFDKEYTSSLEESKEEMTAIQNESNILDEIDRGIKKNVFFKINENNDNLQPWNTMQVAFAYHSKDQDVIYNQINTDVIDWVLCKKLSIPIWLKDTDRLKTLIEEVAKTVYRVA